MTVDQLTPFLRGSFLDGAARVIDLGGNLGVLDGNSIFDKFGHDAIYSDLDAIRQDSVKSFGIMIDNQGK